MFTGNREFNEIYEKYKNLVLKAAYMYSGDNSDAAEDITQDTFLKLYVNFEELKRGNVPSWLFTTAKNAALNFKSRLHEKIFSGLMEKNPRWHDAIVLVYYMNIPQEKAAEILGMRTQALYTMIHRAKKWIRKKYGAEYEEMNRKG